MKKSFVYLLLVGISVYFSFVAGNILADLEGKKLETEEISYHSAGGTSSSGSTFSDYFIPGSSYFSEGSEGVSSSQSRNYESIKEFSNEDGGTSVPKFTLFPKSERKNDHVSAGGGYSPQGISVIRGKKRVEDPIFNGGGQLSLGPVFGGGGNISGGGLSSVTSSGSANATGNFGTNARLSLPGDNFETLAPIPDPTPIPLDNGSIALIIGGLILGAYFIMKNSALLTKTAE